MFPHVLRFFKGFGTMDCFSTIKKNVEVEYKEAVEETSVKEGEIRKLNIVISV